MIVVYILVGILVGGLASYIFFNGKLNESKLAVGTLHTQLEAERAQHQKEIESLKDRFEHETELRNQQSSNEQQLRQKQFDQQLETIQEQFQNLASKILDQTTQKLKSENVESMSHITQPLKQNIELLQQAIDKTNHETARSTASLSEQLKSMAEQTAKIDASATRLTNVMRGANKVQGNWGELTLMNLLDSQGLRLGVDYDVQQTLSDDRGNILTNEESGKRMIPDVILHYPNNEDIIIDSKMTIDAYANYMNAEDEIVKKKYADDVVKSIRTQFTSLSKKDYTSYIKAPRRAIDFVIMYVPYEGALQLALLTDPKLWHDAFEKKVFITSQQNLMAILKIIQIAWRQYAQTENQKRVYDLADEMLRRVGDFIKRFDKVGKDIETLHKDYDEAYKKAYTGRQSIVQKANDLKVLGAKESANAPIPETQMRLDEA
ncbi:DNA recombination protein RmuC [Prevotella salivae]|uniref:DNA recombination protein RmuC n=1 Tax=Segatella salivae TaxID=228604 RepID=UPI001C5F4E73|nr:DNA recombination protein RmuC [Segatella salivae]MBW4906361.1 DNA recombination protein RmuC [Segatella salivae]